MSTTRLVAGPPDIPAVRDELERWLDGHASLDATRTFELLLAATEMLTNAFEHGASSNCMYNMRRIGNRLTLTVTNAVDESNPTIPAPENWSMPDASGRSGRGLAIVRAVADDVSLEVSDRTVAVAAAFDLRTETPAPGPTEATLAS